jgi:hypothetical protein
MMGLVTRQASDLPLAERSVRSGYRVPFDRMIGGERFIQIQELPALHLCEGQSDTPWGFHCLFPSVDLQPCTCMTAQAEILSIGKKLVGIITGVR